MITRSELRCKVVANGKPLIRIGDERVTEWLLEASEGTIYYEATTLRNTAVSHPGLWY